MDPESIIDAITDQTVLISIMHANNEIGTIQEVKRIGDICKKNNILFFVDACQSFGKLDIDVSEMKIDLLSATAHKLYCLLYTSPSPRDQRGSRMPASA